MAGRLDREHLPAGGVGLGGFQDDFAVLEADAAAALEEAGEGVDFGLEGGDEFLVGGHYEVQIALGDGELSQAAPQGANFGIYGVFSAHQLFDADVHGYGVGAAKGPAFDDDVEAALVEAHPTAGVGDRAGEGAFLCSFEFGGQPEVEFLFGQGDGEVFGDGVGEDFGEIADLDVLGLAGFGVAIELGEVLGYEGERGGGDEKEEENQGEEDDRILKALGAPGHVPRTSSSGKRPQMGKWAGGSARGQSDFGLESLFLDSVLGLAASESFFAPSL